MYHILVCDDDRDIVSALTIYLTGEGYAVTGAAMARKRWICSANSPLTWCSWTS